ncbi:MAG: hypothetical protein OCD76_15110 [Reichenbachiella sp.]
MLTPEEKASIDIKVPQENAEFWKTLRMLKRNTLISFIGFVPWMLLCSTIIEKFSLPSSIFYLGFALIVLPTFVFGNWLAYIKCPHCNKAFNIKGLFVNGLSVISNTDCQNCGYYKIMHLEKR